MRLLFKIFSMALIVVGFSSYMGYLKTDRLPWEALQLQATSVNHSVQALPEMQNISGTELETPVYKWRDDSGAWNYSNQPPPEGVEYESVTVNPNANIIASIKSPPKELAAEPESKPAKTQVTAKAQPADSNGQEPALYSPEGIKKLMDDAKNVQKMVDDRAQQQQEIINQL